MDVKELIGVTLGTCALERVIGRGGMGAVFLAQQSRPIRMVAVKALVLPQNIDLQERRVFLERFRREADTAAKLENNHILPVYEYAEAVVNGQQVAYLVMPYIQGGTLRERIDSMNREGKAFDLRIIADYIGQVADALGYAHSRGVVHRDVKPANLLFHQDGRLLLSDFGIARLSDMPSLTTAGNFLGTAEYASPEQANAGKLDARSDIYSLGIILYELLTGHVPFSASNPFAVLAKHINDPVPSIRNARPDLSPSLEFVVKKALAKKPEDRYQSAQEMAADLLAAISPVAPSQSARGMLRLTGDANNNDLTVADSPWQPPVKPVSPVSPAGQAAPGPIAPVLAPTQQAAPEASPIPPTSPAVPIFHPDGNGPPVQKKQGRWPWLARGPSATQSAFPVSPAPGLVQAEALPPTMRQWNRRWYYYGGILFASLAQLFALGLLLDSSTPSSFALAPLGILVGLCVNLYALAAIEFTGIIRARPIRQQRYRCLVVGLAAPLVGGVFVNLGAGNQAHSFYIPLFAYIVMLASNVYTLRQLGGVDRSPEQVRATILPWRTVLIGALTGLLPLTMIVVLTLTASTPTPANDYLLLRLFGALLIVLIGAPTPGAVLAVRLLQPMTAPSFLRSSALAGMLMFAAAFLLAFAWSIATSGHMLFIDQLKFSGLAFVVGLVALSLVGALRGMLDVHLYWWLTKKSGL